MPLDDSQVDLKSAALALAEEGWHVFPVVPGTKIPLCPRGHHEATTDEATIERWWTDTPDANIACVPGLSDVCVIDLDPPDGPGNWVELCAAHGGLPNTYSVQTPSGGTHLYFAGHLPPSAGRLAPDVDTRGDRSYVLVPPSIIGGKTYSGDSAAIAPLPSWIAPALEATRVKPITEAPPFTEDDAANILRSKNLLARAEHLIDDGMHHSDNGCFILAAKLRELGLSETTVATLLAEWQPDFDPDWIASKVANAFNYAGNAAGIHAGAPAAETFKDARLPKQEKTGNKPSDLIGAAEQHKRHRTLKPSILAQRPRATFWDTDKTLPKAPEGCRVVVAGKYSSHKTNLVLAKAMDAIRDHGARVVYCAGEASEELGRERIPAQCAVRGVALADLDATLGVAEECPNLADPADVDAFIAEHADFRPDIVVVDTLSEAITGQDENAAAVASLVMAQAGRIRRAFSATVILVHHLGKDSAKGARGSSVFASGADAVWEVAYDRDAGLVSQKVEKMRRGRAGQTIVWGTRIVLGGGDDGTMTVVPVTPAQAAIAATKGQAQAGGDAATRDIREALEDLGAYGVDKSLSTHDLAGHLAARAVSSGNDPRRQTFTANWAKTLRNGIRATGDRRNRARFEGYFQEEAWPRDGVSMKTEPRWFLPEAGDGAGDEP